MTKKIKQLEASSLIRSTFRVEFGIYTELLTELYRKKISFNQWVTDKIKEQLEQWKDTTKSNLENS